MRQSAKRWWTVPRDLSEDDIDDILSEYFYFDHYSEGPTREDPEAGLLVLVRGDEVGIRQWQATPPPDDPAAREAWEETPVLKLESVVPIKVLFSDGPHRMGYSGDEGWTLEDVIRMGSPQKAKDAIVNVAISYQAYYGGDKEIWVAFVGD
jgi:hypothetical protein